MPWDKEQMFPEDPFPNRCGHHTHAEAVAGGMNAAVGHAPAAQPELWKPMAIQKTA